MGQLVWTRHSSLVVDASLIRAKVGGLLLGTDVGCLPLVIKTSLCELQYELFGKKMPTSWWDTVDRFLTYSCHVRVVVALKILGKGSSYTAWIEKFTICRWLGRC